MIPETLLLFIIVFAIKGWPNQMSQPIIIYSVKE